MSFFIGVDVSKEKFDVCCIGEQEEKIFSLMCTMDREGFEKLVLKLPMDKSFFLLGMESTCQVFFKLDKSAFFCASSLFSRKQDLHFLSTVEIGKRFSPIPTVTTTA